MGDSASARMDKWLWAARFFRTRALALEAIELGRVRIGGERIKPARDVRIGERIEIVQGDSRIEVTVCATSTVRGPAPVARTLYAESAESIANRQRREQLRRDAPEPALAFRGRPTKRDRRKMERL